MLEQNIDAYVVIAGTETKAKTLEKRIKKLLKKNTLSINGHILSTDVGIDKFFISEEFKEDVCIHLHGTVNVTYTASIPATWTKPEDPGELKGYLDKSDIISSVKKILTDVHWYKEGEHPDIIIDENSFIEDEEMILKNSLLKAV